MAKARRRLRCLFTANLHWNGEPFRAWGSWTRGIAPHLHTIHPPSLPPSIPSPTLPSLNLPLLPLTHHTPLPLPLPTPHPLNQPIPLRKPIQTIIPLAHRPHKPAQGINLVLPGVPPVLVHLAHGNLHGAVVFGFDYAACCGAFAGDVAVWGEGS